MDWLSNPWVVGVGGGVVSGFLVTLITRQLFSRRERREYRQKIETANNEIIYAIRPAIAEKVIPSPAMLEALFSATARKYGVNSTDLMSRVTLANELMKEVIDNSFLSSQQKAEFCDLLTGLKQPHTDAIPQRLVEVVTVTKEEAFDPSAFLGSTVAMMALAMTMYLYFRDRGSAVDGISKLLLPMVAVATLIPLVMFLVVELRRRVLRLRKLEHETVGTPESRSVRESSAVNDQTPNKPMQPPP